MLHKQLFLLIICTAAVLLAAGSSNAQEAAAPASDILFYAMGDVPYTASDDLLLPKQIAELPTDGAFVVHVGDIKGGAPPCLPGIYDKVDRMLRECKTPLFIIPGDNEWNDCLIPSPETAWGYWVKHFMRFDQNWQHNLPVFRQLDREENFSFVIDNVLFLGINIVGGRVHDEEEWKVRLQQDFDWVQKNMDHYGEDLSSVVLFGHAHPNPSHKLFFEQFNVLAKSFEKPILYLHGDGHTWVHDHPFEAKNILRVQVDQGAKGPPVQVRVTNDPEEPFKFDRRLPEPVPPKPEPVPTKAE